MIIIRPKNKLKELALKNDKFLAELFHENRLRTWSEKTAFLKKHRIALWDVYAFSDVAGSLDKGLKDFINIAGFLKEHPAITKVLLNGKKASDALGKYLKKVSELPNGIVICSLPSTSGANTRLPRATIFGAWKDAFLK